MPIGCLLRALPAALGVLLVAMSTLLVILQVEPTLDLPAEVRVRDYHRVRVAVEGRVARVLVSPGDHVARGDHLVTLEDPLADRVLRDRRRELLQLERQLERLQLERNRLVEYENAEEAERASQRVAALRLEAAVAASRAEQAAIDLEAARQRLDRSRRLQEAGLQSEVALAEQRFAVESRSQVLGQRRMEAEILERQRAAEAKEAERLQVRQSIRMAALDAQLQDLEDQHRTLLRAIAGLEDAVASREIRAALDGVVSGEEASDLTGRWVRVGDELLTIFDPASIELRAQIPQEALVQIEAGDPVRAEISGLPRQRYGLFEGRVGSVSQTPNAMAGGVSYAVVVRLDRPWIDLDDKQFYLRSGMSGRAEVAYRGPVRLARRLGELLLGE
ncbi:MAG: HlyD family secretion protein [Thermoanaerobaculia bacterium]|nr:HlyD family secretion protein [Thermoanaerobaculia bacterium]